MNEFAPRAARPVDTAPMDYSGLIPTPEPEKPRLADVGGDTLMTVNEYASMMMREDIAHGLDSAEAALGTAEVVEHLIHFSLHTENHPAFKVVLDKDTSDVTIEWQAYSVNHWVEFGMTVMMGLTLGNLGPLSDRF